MKQKTQAERKSEYKTYEPVAGRYEALEHDILGPLGLAI